SGRAGAPTPTGPPHAGAGPPSAGTRSERTPTRARRRGRQRPKAAGDRSAGSFRAAERRQRRNFAGFGLAPCNTDEKGVCLENSLTAVRRGSIVWHAEHAGAPMDTVKDDSTSTPLQLRLVQRLSRVAPEHWFWVVASGVAALYGLRSAWFFFHMNAPVHFDDGYVTS